MSTPRQIVRDYLIAKLQTITIANDYAQDVVTVELRSRLASDLNLSDLPAIILTQGMDRKERNETLGNNDSNTHFREWDWELALIMRDPGDEAIEDAGEVFLFDVIKCLLVNRFNNVHNSKPSDIRFDIASNEWARFQDGTAMFTLNVGVKYAFTRRDA